MRLHVLRRAAVFWILKTKNGNTARGRKNAAHLCFAGGVRLHSFARVPLSFHADGLRALNMREGVFSDQTFEEKYDRVGSETGNSDHVPDIS